MVDRKNISMANPINDLKVATEQISKMKTEVETALVIASTAEGEVKEIKAAFQLKCDELGAANKTIEAHAAQIKEFQGQVEKLQASQLEFDSKVAAAAQKVTASIGIEAIALSPAVQVSEEDAKKAKISKLKGLARATAAFQMDFDAKQKAKK